ncbi:carboxymuconolactone decarboxylase family protein [bacterium]|nr:carboxymuconolactone decarboxylase family protein [bacterium]
MAGEVLSKKQQDIAIISSYSASGDLIKLETALNKGLDDGLTVNEIKEVLIQMYAYCGFPRSLNAIATFMGVVNNRSGKNDKIGTEGKVLDLNVDKNAYGKEVQTKIVGSEVKGEIFKFAPAIDDYLKEHLFADIFARGVLTDQEREIATIGALNSMQGVEPQLAAHILCGKNTGLTQEQIDEILKLTGGIKNEAFATGEKNEAFAKYFIGQSYLNILTKDQVLVANVTFEPRCRNNWHIHNGGGQILLVTDGRGYYQEWGKPARELHRGDVVNIAPGVKHWHGAASDSWFSHIAIEVPSESGSTDWFEPVNDEDYNKLK